MKDFFQCRKCIYGPSDPAPDTICDDCTNGNAYIENRLLAKTDYSKYRGKCREFCDRLIIKDPSLVLVRGYYHCPINGKEQHWWCKDKEGNIIDPTVKQFLTKGAGAEYEAFDGTIECSECGKSILENSADFEGHYAFCSYKCHMSFVGL